MKNSIRKEIIKKRAMLSTEETVQKSEHIFRNLLDSRLLENKKIILNYADFRNEVSTKAISEYAFTKNIPLFYPKVIGNEMEFYQVKNWSDLKTGYQTILEPVSTSSNLQLDMHDIKEEDIIVIIPGAVFSRDGVRYGYGKGFYDRFLSRFSRVNKVALAYSLQLMSELDREEHDIRMDWIITEKEIIHIQ